MERKDSITTMATIISHENDLNPKDKEIQKYTADEKNDGPLYLEIFFIENGSQSNIYCSTKLKYPSTSQERFLVGTLKGKVSCLERCEVAGAKEKFHSSHDMQARPIYFSYIPGDAELISMDAFYRHQTNSSSKRLIVGLTLILLKSEDSTNPTYFFNIYNALEPGTEFDLDKLAQICQHQSLNFIPYHLQHANIYEEGCYETCFLLAGSDQKIHLFRGDEDQKFEEIQSEIFFPEFSDIPGRVVWLDVRNCDAFKRLSAYGCDNGFMKMALCDVRTSVILQSSTLSMDGPISSVRLFTLSAEKEVTRTFCSNPAVSPRHQYPSADNMNLLVTSALEVSVVFLNVATKGLDDMVVLNESDQYDSVTCSCVADVDCDGQHEIVLGTYGQELLVYKWYPPTNGVTKLIHFDLKWKREFSKPLLAIDCLDVMGDGMRELVVVSLTGVHILQHEVEEAADTLLNKVIEVFPKHVKLDDLSKPPPRTNSIDEIESIGEASETGSETNNENESTELDDIINALCASTNSYNKTEKSL